MWGVAEFRCQILQAAWSRESDSSLKLRPVDLQLGNDFALGGPCALITHPSPGLSYHSRAG